MLVDINMSPLNGFELTKRVAEELPAVKVIGLSVNNQPKYAIRIVKMGARGYLTKSSTLEEINHGILEVYKGNIYFCEEIKKHLPPAD